MTIAIKTDPITNFFEHMKKLNELRRASQTIEIKLNDRMYELLCRYAERSGMPKADAAANIVIEKLLDFAAYDQTWEAHP
jgi:hypothetical protein